MLLFTALSAAFLLTGVKCEKPDDELLPQPDRKFFDGWAAWSEWSGCSRSCGGGVRHQLRRCLGKRCNGRSVKYELCKNKTCPIGTADFRVSQCAFYDKKPYRGYIYDKWFPVESDREPCALICKATTYGFSVKFAPKVSDGTRCRNGSSDICADGKCLKIGCDGIVGSRKVLDDCSVCGGNGSSCGRPIFVWKETKKFSACDQTCGPDRWRVSISLCMNSKNGRIVPEKFCADKERPRPKIEKCSYVVCPAEWLVGEWEECNVTCGGGWQHRSVYCAERHNSSEGKIENRKVPAKYCWQNKKPQMGRACSKQHCPTWEAAEWSQCSATCGKGLKTRRVECRQERFQNLNQYACNPKNKPPETQICMTGVSCKEAEKNKVADYERYRYVASAPYTQWSDGGSFGGTGGGLMPKPHFMPSQWTECSTTCGPGVRTRQVDCVAFQGITGNIMRLPDFECEGQARPPDFQPCELRQCPQSAPFHQKPSSAASEHDMSREFRWEYGPYGACSASCLGGKQRSTLKCMDVQKETQVAWSYCDPKQRLLEVTVSCNNQPCPPRWEIQSWSVCSHSCGGGVRTRQVRCIREIAKNGGAESTLILPDVQCGVPKPQDRLPCGIADCPVEWHTEQWTPCSTSCGAGERTRLVLCQRYDAMGELRRYNPPTECLDLEKPPDLQLCDLGPCPGSFAGGAGLVKGMSQIPSKVEQVENDTKQEKTNASKAKGKGKQKGKGKGPNQKDTGKGSKAFTLRVGDRATLFEGMSVKLKCPVKNFDRSKIRWTKDGRLVKAGGRIKISKFGALRIFKAQQEDGGSYVCIAGQEQGNVTLSFKPHEAVYPETTLGGPEQLLKPTNLPQTTVAQDQANKAQAEAGGPVEFDFGKDPDKSALQKLKEYLLRNNELKLYEAVKAVQSPDELKVHFLRGRWSPCSQTCGATEGMQFRQVQCRVEVGSVGGYVNNSLCSTFGITKPHETQLCPVIECPQWKTSEWSDCADSRCIRFSTAQKKRNVSCTWPNGNTTGNEYCTRANRPKSKADCFNRECMAVWRASAWGPCSKSCGDNGVEMRVIRCVWNGTRRAAGNQCQGAETPKVMRPCKNTRPCPEAKGPQPPGPFKDDPACSDESRFCDVVNMLKMCSTSEYRRRCCLTCTYMEQLARQSRQ